MYLKDTQALLNNIKGRFNIEYIGADGMKHRPIMLHRVVFGSIERFMGILIEHYAGKFPMWLAPVQAKILPVSDKYLDYANSVLEQLRDKGLRVEVDFRDEKLEYRLRGGRMERVPYILVVGEKEQSNGTVSVRSRDAEVEKQELGGMVLQSFVEKCYNEINE